ncbi:alanine racemase [Falsiruegeria mediterranea]|uniref:alanine racemase n=1 Tax=Falsiruegeria mediterranea TaxID=1280832 RepID=UPI0015F28419|nr:alanine racemase [Falsiruegeria mediterranea]
MAVTDFADISASLRQSGLDRPAAIVDLDALDHNIRVLRNTADSDLTWRLVAKSLPSVPLLDYIQDALDIRNLMVFSESMLSELLVESSSDQLLGRPMLTKSARRVLGHRPNASKQVQWLIDSKERLIEYDELARELGISLRVNLEIDVGLHRGGFAITDIPMLDAFFRDSDRLKLTGLMGYEPHLAKLPSFLARASKSKFVRTYHAMTQWAATVGEDLVLNTGGSLTFPSYTSGGDVNEVSFGSVMVLPSDFEQSSKYGFVPAAYIATPILKLLPGNSWPGLEFLSRFQRGRTDIVIQGGYFMGNPVYPKNFGYSNVFGRSTNQEIWSGKAEHPIVPGDVALLRPRQSEFVMNGFGPILAYRQGQPLCEWSTLPH